VAAGTHNFLVNKGVIENRVRISRQTTERTRERIAHGTHLFVTDNPAKKIMKKRTMKHNLLNGSSYTITAGLPVSAEKTAEATKGNAAYTFKGLNPMGKTKRPKRMSFTCSRRFY
jgi:hypothetical protein